MSVLGGIDLTGGTIAAFGTLLVYDVFFVTFDQEVALVWPSRWNFGKVLFFLNRYLPFVDTFLSLHLLTGENTDEGCLIGFKIVTWLIVVGILLAEMILMIRTYALWERNRAILVTLIVLAVVIDIPAIVITQLEVNTYFYTADNLGCAKTKPSSPIIFVAFILLIISETVIVVLTLIRAWKHHRQTRSALLVRMYKDGLLYYIYLLAFSLVNAIIAVAAPPVFANWLTTPQRVTHSILCTRVLLHIRSHNVNPDSNIPDTGASMSFATGHMSDHASSSDPSSGTTSSGSRWTGETMSFATHTASSTSRNDKYNHEAIELQLRSPTSPESPENTKAPLLNSSHVKFSSQLASFDSATGSWRSGSRGRGRGGSLGESSRSTL